MSDARPDQLRRQLGTFLAAIDAAAAANPFLEGSAAQALEARLALVIDRWPELNEAERQRVIDTVTYVVDPDDEEHDLLSPIGLVDDEERVAELERELGL